MSTRLADYLRCLEPDRELTVEAYEEAREGLRSLLFGELCRRGLWTAPPCYLGIPGQQWPGEAIDELVSECYAAVFVERLSRLKDRVLVGQDVSGLIVRCVRNFVQDRQRGNDPLGYKLYELVSASLLRLAEAGKLCLVPEGKISNDTVCIFKEAAGKTAPDEVPEVDLGAQVRALNDDLWLGLVLSQGRARSGLDERLDAHLARLGATAGAFVFRDLIEPLKRDARIRWRDGVAEELAGWGSEAPDHDLYDLRECVRRRIGKESAKDQEGLYRLWAFLCDYAAGTNPSPVAQKAEKSGRPPTDLGLEKALGDSRHHVARFKKTLGKMIEQCRSAVSGKDGVRGRVEVGLSRMERHQQLRAATRQAVDAWSARRAEIDATSRAPRPGATFVFPGGGDLLVEWLVLEQGADGRWRVAAVDDRPGAGSRDVAFAPSSKGLAIVRCAVEARLQTAAFESAQRTGTVTDDVLAQVLRKRLRLAQGPVDASSAEQEVDDDADYHSRMTELGELRDALDGRWAGLRPVASANKPPRRSSRSRRGGRLLALAAMLVVGLGSVAVWQQVRIHGLRDQLAPAPYTNLPFVWMTADEPVRGRDDALVVPSGALRLAFILEVSKPRSYPEYRVELERKDPRQEVWSRDGLVKMGSELSFDLPPALISEGEHEIRVYGLAEEGDPDELESYSFWIRLE